MDNGQIITVNANFIVQSLTNNTLEESNFFIGQQDVSIHDFPINIKKTIPTTITKVYHKQESCQEGYRPFPLVVFNPFFTTAVFNK